MDISKEAEDFLQVICEVDKRVEESMRIGDVREHVLCNLQEDFNHLHKDYSHLVEDIKRRIIEYQSLEDEEVEPFDFMRLLNWYKMFLTDKDSKGKEYWDPKNKYYGLRMSEVVDFFLMAKDITEEDLERYNSSQLNRGE